MVTEKGKSVQQVAKELGVCVKTLRDWIERYNKAQRSDAQSIQELEREVKQLKKELAESQEAVEILKKTTAILSKR
jgi:transposase